jgi:uncharacterized protein YihD (DUF1040 family)
MARSKPRPCSRCGNLRPIYDHSAHHCEYCFQLLTNRDQNRLETLEVETKRLQQESFDKSAQIIKLVDERIAQRGKIAALEEDARRLAEIVEMARDYDDDFKGAGWSLRCKLINWGLIEP